MLLTRSSTDRNTDKKNARGTTIRITVNLLARSPTDRTTDIKHCPWYYQWNSAIGPGAKKGLVTVVFSDAIITLTNSNLQTSEYAQYIYLNVKEYT